MSASLSTFAIMEAAAYRRAFSVALHDIDLARIEMQRVAIEEYDIGAHARLLDCLNGACEREPERRRHAVVVDVGGLDVVHVPGKRDTLHLCRDALAIGRLHLLGVVQARNLQVRRQDDGTDRQGPRKRAAAHTSSSPTTTAWGFSPHSERSKEYIEAKRASSSASA